MFSSIVQSFQKNPALRYAVCATLFALLAVLNVALPGSATAIGQIVIVVFGLGAVALGLASQELFKVALLALVCIPVFSVVRSSTLAESFAVYAFLLLCFGLLGAMKEQWRRKARAKQPAAVVSQPATVVTQPPAPTIEPVVTKKFVAAPRTHLASSEKPMTRAETAPFVNRRERAKQPQLLNSPLS